MNEEAVVGIVVTVLLIGLVISVTVMINTVYVPQWTEEQEAAHMDQVANQFTSFKQNVDLQAMLEQETFLSSWFTLGSKEIPILNSGRTFGRLELVENIYNMTLYSDEDDEAIINVSTGRIIFEAGNSYFVPQSYIYENGALILKQYDAHMLIGKPTFFVTTYGKNLSMTVIDLNGTMGKRTSSGYGITPVQTHVTDVSETEVTLFKNITITTDYPNAWSTALNATLRQIDSGFTSDEYRISKTDNTVTLEFINVAGNDPPYPTLDLRRVTVFTQIAPGWIN
jgi:hypothetical protein